MTLATDRGIFSLKSLLNPEFTAKLREFFGIGAENRPIGIHPKGMVKFYFVASDNNANNE